jgi:hypothetical protein
VHPRHPKKEVNDALDYADQLGLEVEQTAAGHKWGRIMCMCGARFDLVDTQELSQPWRPAAQMG